MKDDIDASTASGRLKMRILAEFEKYERFRSERVLAGIAKAHAAGKHWGGRKKGYRPKLTPRVLRSINEMFRAGVSKSEIARQLGINRSTVYEGLKLKGGGVTFNASKR